MEVVRQKNAATYIVFPLVDADGDPVTSAGSLDSEIDTWSDGAAPDGFADCTNEATEIGTTGIYYLSLTQSEMNVDYAVVQIKSTGAKTQVILIRTIVGDPLNVATTDDGGAINVASGVVEAAVQSIVNNAITAASINADAITAAKIADGAIDAATFAAGAINAAAIAADAITAAKIADAAIDAATFAAGAIDASAIAANAIGASELADNAITDATFDSSGKLAAHLPSVLKVVVGAGSTTTAVVLNATTGIDGAAPSATNDFYNGSVLVFTSGALAGQRTDVTDYVGATVTLTVTALTGAPAEGVTGILI